METIKVHIGWSGDNFCAGWEDQSGVVVVTGPSLEKTQQNFREALQFHIAGCLADGDSLPQDLVNGNYELQYELDTMALLKDAENYTSLAAISRASGINPKQLSHYANGVKKARPEQRRRIVDGLHKIANHVMALC